MPYRKWGKILIKARPAFLLLSAAVIPVLVLATIMGWFIIQDRQSVIDATARDRANLLAVALQRELQTQIQLLALVAESPRLDLPVSRSSFAETARRLKDKIPHWEQIRVSNDGGQIVLSFPQLAASASREILDEESHDRLLRSGQGVVGNVVLGPLGKAAFAVRVPIQRNERTRAVLSAVIRPNMITQILRDSGLPQGWSAWVIDTQGRLVSATEGQGLEGKPSAEFAHVLQSNRVELHDGSQLHVLEASLSGMPWRVVVGLPSDAYDRPQRQATLLLLSASLLIAALCTAAAVLFYRELKMRTSERESLANWQRMDALGKLTGQAAHDFNNLLMVFQSGVEGIERRRHDEERVTRLLGHMREGLVKGKNITRRLLSFARRSNQGAEHIDLHLKFDEMAPVLRQALNDTILMDVSFPEDLWAVQAEPVGMEIALINLLTNAREAMPDGGKVSIAGRNIPEAAFEDKRLHGPMVAITVADTGTGIAAEHLERIFEPFFSKSAKESAGLGLTQVHGFAMGCGGLVKAASLIGHGSAFTLLLPKSSRTGEFEDGDTSLGGLPHRILIVDDTPASLESAHLSLEGLVTTILTANSGAEAIELVISDSGIDAVISDIMMPGMSGIELAAELTRIRPGLSVILMTGYSDKLEAGVAIAHPVLSKPFTQTDLIGVLTAAKASKPDLTNVIRLGQATKT